MITIVFLTQPHNTEQESNILNVLNNEKHYPKVDSHHKYNEDYMKNYFKCQVYRFYKYDKNGDLIGYFLDDYITGPDLAVVVPTVEDMDKSDWDRVDDYLKCILNGSFYVGKRSERLDLIFEKPSEGLELGKEFLFYDRFIGSW